MRRRTMEKATPSLTEAAVVIKNMAYIARVAPPRRGFVNDTVAERQLPLYSGYPRSPESIRRTCVRPAAGCAALWQGPRLRCCEPAGLGNKFDLILGPERVLDEYSLHSQLSCFLSLNLIDVF
jgi:hypothetical protein